MLVTGSCLQTVSLYHSCTVCIAAEWRAVAAATAAAAVAAIIDITPSLVTVLTPETCWGW